VLIVWPSQKFQVIKNVAANKQLKAFEKDAAGKFDHAVYFKTNAPVLTEVTESITPNWKHSENDFIDYNVQYLIPHAQSTRGPKIAVGDVNGDGLDDFYACGAKGQPGALMMQQKNSAFVQTDSAMFNKDAACEDVDALFFDANGDGAQDLYVVSGGNEDVGQQQTLLDRLYLNDGKGHFTKSEQSVPAIYENKSCVTAADVDKDGDMDLFVGNLANAKAYGVPQTSYLLLNNGKAQFSVAGQNTIALNNIGMVTSATFTDVNKDGWNDLVVAGEWMPLTVFINKNGQFRPTVISASTGWWQTVYADDVNGDGNMDLLAGNWGWNNKFWSGKNGPVKLYVSDFDKNGQTEQLLSYTLKGKEYPFLAKDEMERALPVLRKHYLLYADYAGLEMADAFYGFAETVTPLSAERLGSAVCYGDGKGGFTVTDLPAELQLAPIFSFQKLAGTNGQGATYVSGGNFFDVIPYEGRYDAQPLALFNSHSNKQISYVHQPSLANIKTQVRDLKWLRTTGNQKILVVAQNNNGLLFYKTGK
jgi:enediyne biosynthesis protein E4